MSMDKSKLIISEVNAKELAEKIKKKAQQASNEEELRIGFAVVMDKILEKWGIKPAYERHPEGYRAVFSGVRKDALYGTVILEFKSPGKFKSHKEFEKATKQVRKYIEVEAFDSKYYGRYFGIVTDGFKIGFVRYRKGSWEVTKDLEINSQTVFRLLEAVRGLKRRPLEARYLLEVFGPSTEISRKSILTLYYSLSNSKLERTNMLFEDWKRVFSQVCAYKKEKLAGLIKYYGLEGDFDVEKLMFSIHTYYTILMKLITSEIVTLFSDSLIGSYLQRLEEAYLRSKENMLNQLREMEEGGIFAELGIKNFLEADYFAWYLDGWNNDIAQIIYEIVTRLLDFEPATVELTPERVEDLFKRLYQNLVPREIRHKLGEYFTPDWLAELLLEEVGFDGDIDKRILDPACGSGTFLVLIIKKIREYAEENFVDKREILRKILENVRGFDLNPLAVLAAKANYIISLADLLRYRSGDIEIPIYLADSIAVSRRVGLAGQEAYMKTVEGEFWIHQEVLDKNILSKILEDIEFCVKNGYSKKDFREIIEKKYELSENAKESVTRLYWKILELEKKGRNRIWTRLLKNSFAPLFAGKFDYVVGNPPWINWEHLPEFYREQTKRLWEYYGLTKRTKGMGLGKVKRDMAMLFLARSLDRYTKNGGKLAFLIPFTVYKTQAGAGFREFLANGFWRGRTMSSPCRVLKIHDLVTLYPFEGAVNRTSLIVIEKSGKTEFPVPVVMWHNPSTRGIGQEVELEEVKKITKQFDLFFIPIEKNKPESPWMEITEKAYEGLKKVIGSSNYEAHRGITPGLNQVYWIEILRDFQNNVLINNPSISGQKKNVKAVRAVIEKDLIYPLVRGRDVKKWYVRTGGWIIIPHEQTTGKTLPENIIKIKYSKTYQYLLNFKNELEKRSIHKLWGKNNPFYSLYDIGKYTFSKYKVVWKGISGAITGKATHFSSAVIVPIKDDFLGEKPVIVPDTLILIPIKNAEEAFYLTGILNSSLIGLLVASYTYELRQESHIINYINIPSFDPSDELHRKIAELSQNAHSIARQIYEENREDLKEDMKKIEEEIDKIVAKLYGITDDELKEIRKCLKILKEGEMPEEGEEEEKIVLPEKKDVELSVEPLLIYEDTQQEMMITIENNRDKSLKNFKVEVKIKSKSLVSRKIKEIKKNERKVMKFKSPKLKSGKYKLKIAIRGEDMKIDEMRELFVKEQKRIKKSKSPLDEEIESLLGDDV